MVFAWVAIKLTLLVAEAFTAVIGGSIVSEDLHTGRHGDTWRKITYAAIVPQGSRRAHWPSVQ
jgi:hypothetical protein